MRAAGRRGALAAAALAVLAVLAAWVGPSPAPPPSAAAAAGDGPGAGFELVRARTTPARALFDGERRIRLHYRFRAERPLDLLIRLVRRRDREPVRRWVERGVRPGRAHVRAWNGERADGGIPADGAYLFTVGPLGGPSQPGGELHFAEHAFPVDGPHRYGDRFGAPRSGGRVHEGQDLPSPCGTRLIAARGGRVQNRGYSHSLYGHYLTIDGRGTGDDHFYAHLRGPSPLSDGARVRSGEAIGAVGMTGNARFEFCQLHFELWPQGYRHGAPHDPLPSLRRWERG